MDFTLSPFTVQIIASVLIPILTGLLTRVTLSSGVKGLITLVLNAIAALVITATVADGTAVISQVTFQQWALGLAISIATYVGVYRPAGVTSSDPAGKLAPQRGIGH